MREMSPSELRELAADIENELQHLARLEADIQHVQGEIQRDLAPRIHVLLRLAEQTDLAWSEEQRLFLARFDRYQIEGRYPDMLPAAPDMALARGELKQAQEVFDWLNRKL